MENVYPMIPAGAKPLYLLLPALIVLLPAIWLLVATVRGSQKAEFAVTDDALILRGDVYGRTIPLDSLVLDSARIVNLKTASPVQPRRRTMGTAAPGYLAGWFRLRNGEKALLYVTNKERVVYVPTRAGYSLLLSPERPDAMLSDLRARAAR